MKYIKRYRVFENEVMSLFDMLDLGIIEMKEVPQAAKGPEEIAALIFALIERDIEEGKDITNQYEYIVKFGIVEKFENNLILDEFDILLSENKYRLINQLFEKYNNLDRVDTKYYVYYVDENRFPIIHYVINGDFIFVAANKVWKLFTKVIGFDLYMTKGIIKKWLVKKYGVDERYMVMSYSSPNTPRL